MAHIFAEALGRAADIVEREGVNLGPAYEGGIDPLDALKQVAPHWAAEQAHYCYLQPYLKAGQTTETVVRMMRLAASRANETQD